MNLHTADFLNNFGYCFLYSWLAIWAIILMVLAWKIDRTHPMRLLHRRVLNQWAFIAAIAEGLGTVVMVYLG
jgi:uncharacterized membrane protein